MSPHKNANDSIHGNQFFVRRLSFGCAFRKTKLHSVLRMRKGYLLGGGYFMLPALRAQKSQPGIGLQSMVRGVFLTVRQSCASKVRTAPWHKCEKMVPFFSIFFTALKQETPRNNDCKIGWNSLKWFGVGPALRDIHLPDHSCFSMLTLPGNHRTQFFRQEPPLCWTRSRGLLQY